MGFMTGLGGFSEGFGKAFSNSFDTSRQLAFREREKKEDRENDVFMQTMKDNAKYMEDLAEAERKDKAIVAKAKTIAQTYGLDAKTTAEIAQRGRDSGGDFTEIESLVKGGKFTSSAANNLTTNPTINQTRSSGASNQLPGLDENSAALQTDSAMGINVEDGVATRPQAQAPSGIDFADGITYTPNTPKVDYNQMENEAKAKKVAAMRSGDRNAEAAADAEINRIRTANQQLNPDRTTGRTAFDLRKELADAIRNKDSDKAQEIQGIITAQNTVEANAEILSKKRLPVVAIVDGKSQVVVGIPHQGENGEIEFTSPEGQILMGATPQSKEEREDVEKILSSVDGPNGQKQIQNIADTASIARSANTLRKMVMDNQDVLSTQAGWAAQFVAGGIHEVQTVGRTLGVQMQEDGAGGYTAESMEALQDQVNGIKMGAIENLGGDKALFDAEMSLLAYRAGAAEGQSGQSFSNRDFNLFTNAIRSSTNRPAEFLQALSNYASGAIKRTDDRSRALTENNPRLNSFINTYDYNPVSQIAPTVQEFIQRGGDRDAIEGYDFVMSQGGKPLQRAENEAAPLKQEEQKKTNSGKTSNGISWSIE